MSEKQECPRCGERAGVPIRYGLATPDLAEDGDVVLGGCVVGPDSFTLHCQACRHEWRVPPPGGSRRSR